MDFKQYVRMMLEAEDAKDENKKAKDEEDIDDEEDVKDDEEDEEEASCKTHKNGCTGCEASVKDDEDDEEEDEEEDEDDEEEDEEKSSKSLKESIVYSSNYIAGNTKLLNEEREKVHVLTESIKNNSASKFLAKLATKAEKDATKLSSKGRSEEAKIAKDSAKQLKEASDKIKRAETRYKAGDPSAKKEYKDLCRQYHKELKKQGRVARGIRNTMLSLIAGSALLGTAGLTLLANDDIIPRLQDGIKDGNLGEVIKGMAIKDKEALNKILKAADEGIVKDKLHNIYDHGKFEITRSQVKDAIKDIDRNAYKNDGYHDVREKAVDVAGKAGRIFGAKNEDGEAFNYKDFKKLAAAGKNKR